MTKPQNKLTQLALTKGKVTFAFVTGNEEEEHEFDEQVFEMPFHTLAEMTELLQTEKLAFFAKLRGVRSVSVDALSFTTESEDKNTRVENLMVDELTIAELVQKQ